MITLRLTLRVGVRAPFSTVKSSGRMTNFLILAYDCSSEFFWSTVRWTRSTTLGCLASTDVVARHDPLLAGELGQLLRVEGDQGHRVGPAVAVDHDLADERIALEQVLDVLGRDVHAAGRDDEILLPVGDEEESVVVEAPDVARGEPAVLEKDLARSPPAS